MGRIRVAIAGVGNCASSLVQGIEFYRSADAQAARSHVGLMHHDLGGITPGDIEVVCAFDVDARKVGHPLDVAADHMRDYPEEEAFVVAERTPVDVAQVLKRSGADILLNYLPVGSQKAT